MLTSSQANNLEQYPGLDHHGRTYPKSKAFKPHQHFRLCPQMPCGHLYQNGVFIQTRTPYLHNILCHNNQTKTTLLSHDSFSARTFQSNPTTSTLTHCYSTTSIYPHFVSSAESGITTVQCLRYTTPQSTRYRCHNRDRITSSPFTLD